VTFRTANTLNLTFNPVVRGFLNASQATDGIGYNYNNSGMSLSTGQRIGSGVAAVGNALEAAGIGYGATKLLTASGVTAPLEIYAVKRYFNRMDNGASLYKSFKPGTTRLNVEFGGRSLYRAADSEKHALMGRFASIEKPFSPADAINRNTLAPEFKNWASQLYQVKTRPGLSVQGVAAGQGVGFEGGSTQVFQSWRIVQGEKHSPWNSLEYLPNYGR
jgi:hypothetical protein